MEKVSTRDLCAAFNIIIQQLQWQKKHPWLSLISPATANIYRLFTQLLKIQSSYHRLLYLPYVAAAAALQAERHLS